MGLLPELTHMKDAPGMRGIRSRDESGPLRRKREDTHLGTIEQEYDRDFGVRADKHLGQFLKENRVNSLHQLIQSDIGKKS
jgi:hypothetical protein